MMELISKLNFFLATGACLAAWNGSATRRRDILAAFSATLG